MVEINLKDDKMSKHERWTALLKHQPMDRIPVFGAIFGFSTVAAGLSLVDFYNNPEKSYTAQMQTATKFRFQDIPWLVYVSFGGWEFGGEIKWPTGEFDQAPTVAKDPVKTANDVEKLQVPNIQTAGIVPYMVDVAKQVNASESPYVMCFVNGPFTTATNICGTETFLKWSLKKPELVTHLLDLSSQFLSDLANYWVELFGAEKVLFHAAEPSTSNQLISPRMFKKFALPYIQNVNKNMLDTGCKHIFYHICGEQNSNLEMWAEVPYGHPGLVSFGHEVDLEKASPYFKNHILMGNIEPAKILSGTPQDVYEETKKCIEKGRNHPGGYMLMTGCEFPPMAPEKNVWAIPQAVSDFGWF